MPEAPRMTVDRENQLSVLGTEWAPTYRTSWRTAVRWYFQPHCGSLQTELPLRVPLPVAGLYSHTTDRGTRASPLSVAESREIVCIARGVAIFGGYTDFQISVSRREPARTLEGGRMSSLPSLWN